MLSNAIERLKGFAKIISKKLFFVRKPTNHLLIKKSEEVDIAESNKELELKCADSSKSHSHNLSGVELEPLCEFMDEYIGQIIVGISGIGNIQERCDCTIGTIITSIDIYNDAIRFRLSSLGGLSKGHLLIYPTEFGMFRERLSDDKDLDKHMMFQISFYDGLSLEYLDVKNLGTIEYEK